MAGDSGENYNKVVAAKRELIKEIEMRKQREEAQLLANQDAARKEKSASAHKITRKKRDDKSTEAFDKLWASGEEMKKTSMKTYDTLAAALIEIFMHSLLISKALNAEMWAMLAGGDLSDEVYENIAGIVNMPVDWVQKHLTHAAQTIIAERAAAKGELTLSPEILAIPLHDMIKLDSDGKLEFKQFANELNPASNPDPESKATDLSILKKLDKAYQHAVPSALKIQGYERQADGTYEHAVDGPLTSEKLKEVLIKIADVEQLIEHVIKNEPPAPRSTLSR